MTTKDLDRFQVVEIKLVGTGAGMFAILDTYIGEYVGRFFYWRNEAESCARRMTYGGKE